MKEIKKLTNVEMKNIVGGADRKEIGTAIMTAGIAPVAVGALAGLGLHIGSVVYSAKARRALISGDMASAHAFVNKAEFLDISALVAAGSGLSLTVGAEIGGSILGGHNALARKALQFID